ncbi:hypothetical protein O6H91_05G019600 [Diphasiastrum complanatum]|uniref:Uncharacterized protein n=1 Tax=Diphasiastrum complanatum TaxID=34168 RepID=A0ACC2DLJ0_DIPCM|nr:hypothetical protein O6H91_05G019600 [Diphasiastrum complanatum]
MVLAGQLAAQPVYQFRAQRIALSKSFMLASHIGFFRCAAVLADTSWLSDSLASSTSIRKCLQDRSWSVFLKPPAIARAQVWKHRERRHGLNSSFSNHALEPSNGLPSYSPSSLACGLKEVLENSRIKLSNYVPGQYRTLCPWCEGGSTREKSLAVRISDDGLKAVYLCHRGKCGAVGFKWPFESESKAENVSVNNSHVISASRKSDIRENGAVRHQHTTTPPPSFTADHLGLTPLSQELVSYFQNRCITLVTLKRNGVMQLVRSNNQVAIAFPLKQDGKIVNCKYRGTPKHFWQEKGGEKVLYGLDDIKTVKEIIIVEGEIDKLSMEEAGFLNCVSVPDGAPPKASPDDNLPPIQEDKKYGYLWACKDYFEKVTRIVLATDADDPGSALAEELARRLGRERCWRVKWPKSEDGKQLKDANEVLVRLGKEALKAVVEKSELYPIRGLFPFSNFYKEIDDYYHLRLGNECGVSTGWVGLDEFYKVVPGELTIITGVPNSGKSEWIDALMCNLNSSKSWTFALCSMENKVREHARKLLEKHLKKPFFDALYSNSVPRMTREDLECGKKWLNDNFFLIRCEDDELPSVDWVLNLAKAAVLRHGIRGLVIDPYNELDHQRPNNQTETEYVSQILTKVKRFAQHHDCHVWFVAHPKQLQIWRGQAPNLYDISGSAHFINKCDNGLVIHRNRDADAGPLDEVLVRKVRNKAAGTIGDAILHYDRVTGAYFDVEQI